MQIIYNRPGVSLTTILSNDLPADVPGNIKRIIQGLYGLGSGQLAHATLRLEGLNPPARGLSWPSIWPPRCTLTLCLNWIRGAH